MSRAIEKHDGQESQSANKNYGTSAPHETMAVSLPGRGDNDCRDEGRPLVTLHGGGTVATVAILAVFDCQCWRGMLSVRREGKGREGEK